MNEAVSLLRLYFEFFQVGLFSVGGGLATIPFLQDMGERTAWFTSAELANMIAVSESTPGPMGVNMASYVGFQYGGMMGSIVATLGVISPCIVIISIIAPFLVKFRDHAGVQAVFYGLRPASAALILSAAVEVCQVGLTQETEFGNILSPPALVLAMVIWGMMYYSGKKLHPVVYVALSGCVGMAFGL